MKVEQSGFQFDYCLTYKRTEKTENWFLPFEDLEKIAIINDIYQTGPIFFSIKEVPGENQYREFKYYLPINEQVEIETDQDLFGCESIKVEFALKTRNIANVNLQCMQEEIIKYAKENQFEIESELYCIFLDVYNDVIFDFYAPLRNEVQK
ncbi:DUF5085 family protein [Listeria welshimeri]|uniref:DUF5085 family protein n=1 Tax=Listeria welshimeri TaxID=1643 RepID=UPI0010B36F84|nr:DUF5085 family protein [Listeria welshimeri]MBC1710555.1 hypothetical protein [Listeria welshimeri]MBC2357329.1 hypothetical protein [Listeria welshimeri]MBC6139451.1 hypothetical protein [Listeria welshimeri]MBF2368474.1 hypothetical protein [Listeria welshimeri]MBF2445347.1 hypothetical protein [Listeria welshimeri]